VEKILVVDDNPQDREFAGQCLRDHGMIPLFAASGDDAIRTIETDHPDAVLTDLHMPGMDGLDLVRHVRSKYSGMPVVLMTSRGSEESAIRALRAGALSYVPKDMIRSTLCSAMEMVTAAVEQRRFREQTRRLLERSEAHFVLGYEVDGPAALVNHLQSNLREVNFCDDTELFQIGTALAESFNNAIDHGNLELESRLREDGTDAYSRLRYERATASPFRDRRVRVTEHLRPDTVRYTVLDEGRGFDVRTVPDPRHPDCLLKLSGRGLFLVRTFMDEVTFNAAGNEITMTRHRRERVMPAIPV
jgi:CheY-like chemotaxis protein/anti-sigma regulatory factor (Ser/Thr protein kinase)